MREVRELATAGVREAVFIAQNTTAYGRDLPDRPVRPDLAQLLRAVAAEVPEMDWLRACSMPTRRTSPQNSLPPWPNCRRVCHYLDLPLQHGHPDVLRRMRRPYDLDQVYALLEALQHAMPDLVLRSTFIVGYPGETDAEFEALLEFMKAVAFDKVGVLCLLGRGRHAGGRPARSRARRGHCPALRNGHDPAAGYLALFATRSRWGGVMPVLVEGSGPQVSIGPQLPRRAGGGRGDAPAWRHARGRIRDRARAGGTALRPGGRSGRVRPCIEPRDDRAAWRLERRPRPAKIVDTAPCACYTGNDWPG